MTVQQCKYVLEIAKTGSFSEAAKQLFVAKRTTNGRPYGLVRKLIP